MPPRAKKATLHGVARRKTINKKPTCSGQDRAAGLDLEASGHILVRLVEKTETLEKQQRNMKMRNGARTRQITKLQRNSIENKAVIAQLQSKVITLEQHIIAKNAAIVQLRSEVQSEVTRISRIVESIPKQKWVRLRRCWSGLQFVSLLYNIIGPTVPRSSLKYWILFAADTILHAGAMAISRGSGTTSTNQTQTGSLWSGL